MNSYPLKIVSIVSSIALVLLVYLVIARPYQLKLGATAAEISRRMPGDELNETPSFAATRAISIDGSADEIYPWLVQMGHGRAGFYGFDLIENIGSPSGLRSANRILPDHQDYEAGDALPISSIVELQIYDLQEDEYIVWSGQGENSATRFTWALYPESSGKTRLVSRVSLSYSWTKPGQWPLQLFTEFADHLAVRQILTGIKQRVEGNPEAAFTQDFTILVFLLSLGTWLLSLGLLLVKPLSVVGWLLSLLAGSNWLISWYGGIPSWLGLILTAAVLTLCWWTYQLRILSHWGAADH